MYLGGANIEDGERGTASQKGGVLRIKIRLRIVPVPNSSSKLYMVKHSPHQNYPRIDSHKTLSLMPLQSCSAQPSPSPSSFFSCVQLVSDSALEAGSVDPGGGA